MRDLSRPVDTSKVESSICTQGMLSVECDDGVSGKEGDDTKEKEGETADVDDTTGGEDASAVVALGESAHRTPNARRDQRVISEDVVV